MTPVANYCAACAQGISKPAVLGLAVVLVTLSITTMSVAQTATVKGRVSGLPIPRFVSLKSDRVNVRIGSGKDHRIAWVYQRAGLPVEVIEESGNWRQVRDSDSAVGWVFHGLLSGRRTAIVMPWMRAQQASTGQAGSHVSVALRESGSSSGDVIARIQPGAVAGILSCDGTWCQVAFDQFRGWLEQKTLWGVYKRELVK